MNYYYVAFVDLLGFSEMVKADCNGPANAVSFLPKLFTIHGQIVSMAASIPGAKVTQFSDSIVVSAPYNVSQFATFAELIAKYQYYLLENGVLCRGGISFGKHFQEGSFIFSDGLIKAYNIEVSQARYPRIVVDLDIIELLSENGVLDSCSFLKEKDGAMFLHYMRFGDINKDLEVITRITKGLEHQQVSVMEKLSWLQEYFSFCYPAQSFNCTRFKSIR